MKKIGIFVFALFAGAVSAQASPAALPPGIEERFRLLENEIKALRQENQQLRQDFEIIRGSAATAPAPGQIFVKPAGKEAELKLGGLIQGQADFGDKGDSRFTSDNDRFYLRRTRLNATGNFLEDFDFKLELDLAGTLTETTGLRALLTDAYVNWNQLSYANIKAGQFKTPFGYEQLAKDSGLYTIERSLPNDRLTLGRQLGVQVNGDFFEKRLSYAVGMFNGNGANNNFNDDDNFVFVQRLSAVPWQGTLLEQESSWSVGANAYQSRDNGATGLNDFGFTANTLNGKRFGTGGDTQLHVGRFDFWAEYLRGDYKPLSDVPASYLEAQGGYLQASYFVIPKKFQPILKYDFFDPNSETDDNNVTTWTLGLNYYIKGDDLKLQFNYLLNDADGQPEDYQDKFLARIQAMF